MFLELFNLENKKVKVYGKLKMLPIKYIISTKENQNIVAWLE